MNTENTKEYNAFGPWVYEIKGEHDMPPLFVNDYQEKEQPQLLVKIPRRIDRRDATPDMHLYDYVVGAFDTCLYILKRVNDSVVTMHVPYSRVLAVKSTVSMLKGQVLLYLDDDVVTIEYNTVSEPIMTSLVNIIRDKYNKELRVLEIGSISHDIDMVGHLYSAIIDRYAARDSRIRLVAYQPPSKFLPRYDQFREKMKGLMKTKQLITGTAFLTNDTELMVLQRDKLARSRKQGDLTHSMLFLPFGSIEKIISVKGFKDSRNDSMNISIQGQVFSFLYSDSNRQVNTLIRALKNSQMIL